MKKLQEKYNLLLLLLMLLLGGCGGASNGESAPEVHSGEIESMDNSSNPASENQLIAYQPKAKDSYVFADLSISAAINIQDTSPYGNKMESFLNDFVKTRFSEIADTVYFYKIYTNTRHASTFHSEIAIPPMPQKRVLTIDDTLNWQTKRNDVQSKLLDIFSQINSSKSYRYTDIWGMLSVMHRKIVKANERKKDIAFFVIADMEHDPERKDNCERKLPKFRNFQEAQSAAAKDFGCMKKQVIEDPAIFNGVKVQLLIPVNELSNQSQFREVYWKTILQDSLGCILKRDEE